MATGAREKRAKNTIVVASELEQVEDSAALRSDLNHQIACSEVILAQTETIIGHDMGEGRRAAF